MEIQKYRFNPSQREEMLEFHNHFLKMFHPINFGVDEVWFNLGSDSNFEAHALTPVYS